MHLLTLLLAFLTDYLGDTKTIRPFILKGFVSQAMGLIVSYSFLQMLNVDSIQLLQLFFIFYFLLITNTTYNTYSYYDTNKAYITYDTTPNY